MTSAISVPRRRPSSATSAQAASWDEAKSEGDATPIAGGKDHGAGKFLRRDRNSDQ
jgi:hypothetical protein